MKPKFKFVITYKSGARMEIRADELTVTRNTALGTITKMEWDNMQPKALFLGMDDIESIWQV